MSIPKQSDLHEIFVDENKCLEYLREKEVFYKILECEICSSEMRRIGNRNVLRCIKCRKEKSERANTFFYGSRLQCCQIIEMAYYWLVGLNQKQTMLITKRAESAVSKFFEHFRILVSSTLNQENNKIGGENIIVEIDESKIAKRKYHRGHHVEGAWLVGGVELTSDRKLFFVSVENRNSETLKNIIENNVLSGSIIRTDLWKGYSYLSRSEDYLHQTVNHSRFFKDPETGIHTNTIEGTWSALKRRILPRNRTKNGIEGHLTEYIWRRKNEANLWDSFIFALKDIHYTI